MTETNEFAWLDAAPPAVRPARKKKRVKKAKRKAAKRPVKVEVTTKVNRASMRGKAMFQAVNGRKRIWACDGEYVFFRRKSCIDPAQPGLVHAAITRHQRFLDRGDYTYVETQDDVEICKVNEQSPFYRQGGVYLGQLSEGGLNRAVVLAACKRDWVLYADVLEELAGRVKGKWQTEGQRTVCWNEHLAYIDHLVSLRGGPTPEERGVNLARVRQARGEGKGKVILLPGR
jgi:hypothetical protein